MAEALKSYSIVTKDGKKGMIDSNGTIVIPVEHQLITFLNNGYISLVNDGQQTIVDYHGNLVKKLEPQERLSKFHQGVSVLRKKDRTLYLVDENTSVLKKIESLGYGGNVMEDFSEEGYAVISAPAGSNHGGGPTGVINAKGEVVIDYLYSEWKPVNGKYWVTKKKGGKYGVLTMQNEIVLPFEYEDINYEGFDKFYVKKQIAQFDSKYPLRSSFKGYWLDNMGKQFIDASKYDWIQTSADENLIEVSKDNKYGFLDMDGKEVIPLIYDSAINVISRNGLIWVIKDGKGGFINTKNEVIIPFQFADDKDCPPLPGVFEDGWTYVQIGDDCITKDKDVYLLTEENEKRLIGQFYSAYGVQGGVVVLYQKPNKKYLLKKDGKLIDVSRYDKIGQFQKKIE